MTELANLAAPVDTASPAPTVSVVLPCLNEEASVGQCVTQALAALAEAGLPGEVVVVDNGSTDRSRERALEAGARVVEEPVPGYGSALARGILAARGEVVVMADADLTYPLERLSELVLPVLAGEADIMLGSRLDAATRRSMPLLHRYVGTPALTFLIRRGCGGMQLTDSQSGFRAFRRDRVLDLHLEGTGMEFASEMLIRASHASLRVGEVATGYRERVGESKLSTFRDGLRHVRLILRLNPHLALVAPGAVSLALGVLVFAAMLVWPSGLEVGSLRWQPVFFSSIATTLGLLALLAGVTLARYGPGSDALAARYQFVSSPRFLTRTRNLGLVLGALGVAIDLGIFVRWVSDEAPSERVTVMAGLAQSLIVAGAVLVSFAAVKRAVSSFRRL